MTDCPRKLLNEKAEKGRSRPSGEEGPRRDQVEEKMGLVKVDSQNYEVMVEDKRVGNDEGAGSSKTYDT